ncbi:hypothetical protein HK102_010619, partial [Quaeritorhiza haematococci]
LSDYVRLLLAFVILILEAIIRILFAILPLRWLADIVRARVLTAYLAPPSTGGDNGANANATAADLEEEFNASPERQRAFE